MTKKSVRLRIIRNLKLLITKWERNLITFTPTDNPYHLVDLTPKADLEKSKSYRKALKWALENDEVFNIALTGPYGSGKSSILKAFVETNTQYKYLKISLASFSDDSDLIESVTESSSKPEPNQLEQTDTEDHPSDKESDERFTSKKIYPEKKSERIKEKARQEQHRQIELSILQQIFYRVTDEKLPQSRFKRIKKLNVSNLWKIPLIVTVWSICAYFIYNKDFRTSFYNWKSMSFSMEAWLYLVCLCLSGIGLFWLMIQASRLLFNAKFSKLNVLGGGLELNYSVDKSILNKHLDEILYFFEETDFDIIIIEDLDRFNDADIFTKLRELNLLINNAEQVPRPIKFIYAIKDDMFTDGNRTKFFDFIIPVLPVINYSNALDKFLPKLEAAGLDGAIPKKFLYDITLYINDMRVLNNIFNEFMLYKENLNQVKNLDKLLAMIVYKNIEPRDFAELHNHSGIIHSIMNAKPEFIKYLSAEISNDISVKTNLIKKIHNETASSIMELRAAYIQTFVEMATYEITSFLIEDKIALKDMTKDENFEKLKKSTGIIYNYQRPSGTGSQDRSDISFKKIEQHVSDISYDDRETFVKAKKNNELVRVQKEIDTLKVQLNILKTRSYKNLLTTYKTSIDFFDVSFSGNELLVYLVRGGYIDEMYERYMSYFYEKSLKTTDVDFLKHIRNLEPQPFDYSLTNIEELLHRLEAEDFVAEELLNFDLLDYIFKNEPKFKPHLKALFDQFANQSKRSLKFSAGYILRPKYAKQYVVMLAKHWPGMWEHMSTDQQYTKKQLESILTDLIANCQITILDQQNKNEELSSFIEQSESLCTQKNSSEFEEKLKNVIEHFQIRFKSLNKDQISSTLFDFIYKNNYYRLTPQMVSLIIMTKGQNQNITQDNLRQANYTNLLVSGAKELIDYVSESIGSYLYNTKIYLPENTKESEQAVQLLLNNSNLWPEQYEEVIKKQECKITDINSINQPLWKLLVENNKMAPNWHNVLNYFNISGILSPELATFLNESENHNILASHLIIPSTEISEDRINSISLTLLQSKELTKFTLVSLINAIPVKYDQQNIFATISRERIELMIKKGNIPLSAFNFSELKAYHDGTQITLVVKNIATYLKSYIDYSLAAVDNQNLLSSTLSEKYKLKIAELINDSQLETSSALAQLAGRLMIKNGHIPRTYTKILSIAAHGITDVNLNLVALHLQDFNTLQVRELLHALGGKYSETTDKKKNPIFPVLPVNELILSKLKIMGIIVDYELYKGKLKVYHTPRRKK